MTKRRPITDAMKLAALRTMAMVTCSECRYDYGLDEIEFDHWLAIVDGGEHTVENLRPLCVNCHAKKSAREHIANCKAKRIAVGGKKVRHPMQKTGRKLQSRPFPKRVSK